MARHYRNRSNYNRVPRGYFQGFGVQPPPQVQVPIYFDAAGYFVLGQIGGFYYRIPVNVGQPRPHPPNTSNPNLAPNKQPRLDPHEVLGIPASATMKEISKAYRRKAKENHPDTVVEKTPESLAHADQKMKEINEAYKILKSSHTYEQPYKGK